MLELIAQRIKKYETDEQKRNALREFLQILILKILFDSKAFNKIAFVGGTALRILHKIRRYSEDLDFSLINKKGYAFSELINKLSYELKHYGFTAEIDRIKERSAVHSVFIKFKTIYRQLGIKTYADQKLSIKLEIDTSPPLGFNTTFETITDSFIFMVRSFDLPSLFATKLHACFYRPYTKGRDFYDLVWYLSKGIIPNFALLNKAILQTEGNDPGLGNQNIKEFLKKRVKALKFEEIRKDVERFIEDKRELNQIEPSNLLRLIDQFEDAHHYLLGQGFRMDNNSIGKIIYYHKQKRTIMTQDWVESNPNEAIDAAIPINPSPRLYGLSKNSEKKDVQKIIR